MATKYYYVDISWQADLQPMTKYRHYLEVYIS